MNRASSQKDMFESDTEDGKARISSSLGAVLKARKYNYDGIVLFNWDVDLDCPFSDFSLSMFTDTDLKSDWITKNLGNESRILQMSNLSPFPGQKFSLFGKIEFGKCYITFKNNLLI